MNPDGMTPGKGRGKLEVASGQRGSVVVRARSQNPLKVLTPRPFGPTAWAYTSNFGGGMVAGDQTHLHLQIDDGATCFLGTQSSTKIYRNPGRLPCSFHLEATLRAHATLVYLPDPIQCFADSCYAQDQHFILDPSSSLVMTDWLSAGRSARGERWSFHHYSSRLTVERAGRTLLFDSLLLDSEDGSLDQAFSRANCNALATVVIFGPRLHESAKNLLAWVHDRPISPRGPLLVSASPLEEGLILRLAGAEMEEMARTLQGCLDFVPGLLQDDPWARKF